MHTHTLTHNVLRYVSKHWKPKKNILPTLLFSVDEFLKPLFEHNEAPSFFADDILIYILNWICFNASYLWIVSISLDTYVCEMYNSSHELVFGM